MLGAILALTHAGGILSVSLASSCFSHCAVFVFLLFLRPTQLQVDKAVVSLAPISTVQTLDTQGLEVDLGDLAQCPVVELTNCAWLLKAKIQSPRYSREVFRGMFWHVSHYIPAQGCIVPVTWQ